MKLPEIIGIAGTNGAGPDGRGGTSGNGSGGNGSGGAGVDPIENLGRQLVAAGVLDEAGLAAVKSAATERNATAAKRAAHAMNVKTLKRVFALLLYALAAYMLYRGLNT